ncbi:hypothetical protein BH20ACT15_BH20ACT15_12840 [soil metagenome]
MTIELAGARVENRLPGRQGVLLFTYLVLRRERKVGRQELIEALWPERTRPRAADSALSALLSKLRRALGADVLPGRGDARLALPADAWIDLEVAAGALHRAESAIAQEDWRSAWAPARIVLHTANRAFLPGEEAD